MRRKTSTGLIVALTYLLPGGLFPQALSQAEKEYTFAEQLYNDNMFSLAAKQFREFAAKYPNDEKADAALFFSGESYFKAEEYEKAFEAFKQLELSYPRSSRLAEARSNLATSVAAQGDFAAAGELYLRVPVFHPKSEFAAKALLKAGRAFRKAGDAKAALRAYFKLTAEYPESGERFEAHLEIVRIHLDAKNYDAAIEQVDGIFRAYGPDLNDPRAYALRAQIYQDLGQDQEAEAIYQKLISNFPQSREARAANYYLGVLHQERGDYDAAMRFYDKVAGGNDELTSRAHLKRGEILILRGNYNEAISAFEMAEFEPATASVVEKRLLLASAHERLGHYDLAASELRAVLSALKTSPFDSSLTGEFLDRAYVQKVNILTKQGKHEQALQVIDAYAALQTSPERLADLYYQKARIIELELRDYARALRAYGYFAERFHNHRNIDDAYAAIGRCHEGLGEYRQALREYQRFLDDYPGGERYAWVEERVRIIRESISLDEGRGLQGLSKLFTKLNNRQDSLDWNYEVAKVHYEAKDFETAIPYFKQYLRSAKDGIDKVEAYFCLGNTYFQLYRKGQLQATSRSETYRDSAAISLQYVVNSGDSQWGQQAFHRLTQIRLDSFAGSAVAESELLQIYKDWLKRFPGSHYVDEVMIRLADLKMRMAAQQRDTTAVSEALRLYRELMQQFPDSDYSEPAQFGAAKAQFYLGADSLARRQIARFLNDQPRSQFAPEALFILAELAVQNQNYESALQHLNRIQREFFYSPWAQKAKAQIADVYFKIGDYSAALDSYGNGTNGAAEDAGILFMEAQAHEKLGNLNQALNRYVAFVRENPQAPEVTSAMLSVARIARTQGNAAFAKEYYEKISKHAASVEHKYLAQVALGDLHFEQERFAESRDYYLQAMTLAADDSQLRYPSSQSIRCSYRLKRFAAADADAKVFRNKFKETRREEAQFLVDRGQAYMDDKNFELAEQTYKKLRSDFKDTEFAARGEYGLGAVYLITNHTEDALKTLTALPSKYPDSEVTPLTYFNLGDFYYKSQQVQNAMSAFKQVIAHPKAGKYHQLAMRYLIKCYNDVRLWDQAIALNREYLQQYPYAEDAFDRKIDIARNLMNLKEYHRAIENFNTLKMHADTESEAELQFYLGQCYKEMGDFQRATSEYLKVKYLTKPTKLPWHVTALFEAADCLIRLKEFEQAETILQRILREEGNESNFGRFARQKLDELLKQLRTESDQ